MYNINNNNKCYGELVRRMSPPPLSPPLLRRWTAAGGGGSYWSFEDAPTELAYLSFAFAAGSPGPSGAPGSPGPASDQVAALDAELDALYESLDGRFASEEGRCPFSLSCNDSVELDLDRRHLTYGEITSASLLEALQQP